MLTCREIASSVTDYLERKMPLLERIRVGHHIRKCRGCQEFISNMKNTVEFTQAIDDECACNEETKKNLSSIFKSWHEKKNS